MISIFMYSYCVDEQEYFLNSVSIWQNNSPNGSAYAIMTVGSVYLNNYKHYLDPYGKKRSGRKGFVET